MRKIQALSIALLIAVVVAATFLPGPIFAADPGITGKVINATTSGGGPVGGLEVVLTAYVNSAVGAQQKTTTDAQGNFSFSGLSTEAGYSYKASVAYQNVEYTSDPVQLTASNPTQAVTVHIYETTNDGQSVKVSTGHMVIFPSEQGTLTVLEAWGFNNSGDRTYIGPGGQGAQSTAHFTLPSGAADLTGEGFALDAATGAANYAPPIAPGMSFASYTYSLSYQSDTVAVSRKMDYAVPSFSILVPQQGMTAKSTSLTQAAPQNIQGVTYIYLTGTNLNVGQNVDVSLTVSAQAFASPTSGSNSSTSSGAASWLWFVVAAVAVALGAAVAYVIIFRRRAAPAVARAGSAEDGGDEEDALLEQMAHLDDEFDAGQLSEQEYRQRRAQAKERLARLRSQRSGR